MQTLSRGVLTQAGRAADLGREVVSIILAQGLQSCVVEVEPDNANNRSGKTTPSVCVC